MRKSRSPAACRESKSLALRIPVRARVPARGQECDCSGTFASISGCAGDRAVCRRHPAANSARLSEPRRRSASRAWPALLVSLGCKVQSITFKRKQLPSSGTETTAAPQLGRLTSYLYASGCAKVSFARSNFGSSPREKINWSKLRSTMTPPGSSKWRPLFGWWLIG